MEYIFIGRIVDTHGIKGELRIFSDFSFKERILKKDTIIYIGKEKTPEKIMTYRKHKEYDMVTFENYNNINQVLKYKKEKVYVLKSDLSLDNNEYLKEDLIGLFIIKNGKNIGKVEDIEKVSKTNEVIRAIINKKEVLIPYHKDFIKRVDLENKEIEFSLIEGMLNEN